MCLTENIHSICHWFTIPRKRFRVLLDSTLSVDVSCWLIGARTPMKHITFRSTFPLSASMIRSCLCRGVSSQSLCSKVSISHKRQAFIDFIDHQYHYAYHVRPDLFNAVSRFRLPYTTLMPQFSMPCIVMIPVSGRYTRYLFALLITPLLLTTYTLCGLLSMSLSKSIRASV